MDTPIVTNIAMWEIIVAFFSATIFLPVIQQPKWSTSARAAITFFYSVIVGTVTAYLNGAFAGAHDFKTWITAVLLLLVATVSFYTGFAKPIGIAPAIERLTSPTPR